MDDPGVAIASKKSPGRHRRWQLGKATGGSRRGRWLVFVYDRSRCLSHRGLGARHLAISDPPTSGIPLRFDRGRVFRKDLHQKTSPQPLALARRCCDINELDNKRLAVSRVELELIGGKLNPPGSLEHLISKPIKRQTPAPRLE